MDSCTMDLLKCEPEEVIVKYEPLFTENSYDTECDDVPVNNDNLVKTECEPVSLSSTCGSFNDDITKQECKCSFCMKKQVAITTNISTMVKEESPEESSLTASEYSQENTDNLMSTKNSASCMEIRKPKTRPKAQHHCPYCIRNFTRRDSFSIHLWRKHSKKNPDVLVEKLDKTYFTCDICKFKSSCSRSLKLHMLMHETFVDTNNIFKCDNCDYETFRKFSLHSHNQRKHSNTRPTYSCRFCNKTFLQKGSLADHLLSHHGDKFDKSLKKLLSLTIKHCKLCDFRVITKTVLNHHIQTQHSSDRKPTSSCRFCEKSFLKKVSLADHLLCHHGEKFDKSLKTLLSLTINQCTLCDFRVIDKNALNQHIQKKHSSDKHTYYKHTYSCRFCNKTFFNKVNLGNHLLLKHGKKIDKSLKTLLSLTIKVCKLCDFRAISKCMLDRHIQSKHSNDRKPTSSCRFCNKTFFKKGSLADHLLCKHGEEFNNSLKKLLSHTIKHCTLCDFRVISKTLLNDHIQRQHSNDRKPTSSCRFCDKSFLKKASLADHLLCKHGEKFAKSLETLVSQTIKHCKLCDFRGISLTKLKRHIQSTHSNDTHSCQTV